MDFNAFKELHVKFKEALATGRLLKAEEHEAYTEALYSNKQFSAWVLTEHLDEHEFDHSKFCCIDMAHKIFESLDNEGKIKYDDHDVIMNKWKDGTYGIPIHDGGAAVVKINYCPWCGTKLNNE